MYEQYRGIRRIGRNFPSLFVSENSKVLTKSIFIGCLKSVQLPAGGEREGEAGHQGLQEEAGEREGGGQGRGGGGGGRGGESRAPHRAGWGPGQLWS
jgi:hypothetical protein